MTDPNPNPRGRFKVYLGYAAGVGTTYQMLEDAHQARQKGSDLVIGNLEPHGREDTLAKAAGLELIPRRELEHQGSVFDEMDFDAARARKPQVCLVDELPHTNVPGSEHRKRWEDALVLLEAGINVWTTMNVQHLESLNDQVWQMTGVRVQETVPDWVMDRADEVIMVDLSPRALLNRLARGVVYPPEMAQQARENFFKESSLVALRELALRQTAHEVEIHQAPVALSVARDTFSEQPGPAVPRTAPAGTDRILVHLTEDPSTAMAIRRGKRVADYLQAECFAVYVHREPDLFNLPAERREAIRRHLTFARNLHLDTHTLRGEDTARVLLDFARLHRITQIFMARPHYSPWQGFLGMKLVHRVVGEARDMQVTIVAERKREAKA
jgi:two-component system, OmpR family, sensor histidine kinase KdpD